jgi:ParB-like chromosome segregation protein Spo0J
LLSVLASAQTRGWDAIEEALMVRELVSVLGLSQHEVAQRIGRDASWVNRRLRLLDSLSEELLEAVCQGVLSSWAASRILAPLARANTAHAHALLGSLRTQALSTRELNAWYRHYSQANRATRERLVDNPALFVHTLRAREEAASLERLREGPEGQCLADLQCLEAILKRLRKRLASVCTHAALPADLQQAFAGMKRAFTHLDNDLQGYRIDDPTPHPRSGPHTGCESHTGA